jgi:hypothetical protein
VAAQRVTPQRVTGVGGDARNNKTTCDGAAHEDFPSECPGADGFVALREPDVTALKLRTVAGLVTILGMAG